MDQPAHPRAGGENWRYINTHSRSAGSSPRWRGKPPHGGELGGGEGLIPALAGKTQQAAPCPRTARAHPRAGGENPQLGFGTNVTEGSSPRWRGKPLPKPSPKPTPGLIPALAGKTCIGVGHPSYLRAHPRAGGENNRRVRARLSVEGSSPRWRGKHCPAAAFHFVRGLIPALAGKTTPERRNTLEHRAHPRAGGENLNGDLEKLGGSGSSPRWRGKPNLLTSPRGAPRLIPALAGKTRETCSTASGAAAHPRAGGENLFASMVIVPSWGSSPRWRGKRLVGTLFQKRVGLIPALAGKTRRLPASQGRRQAHPRAGGENVAW